MFDALPLRKRPTFGLAMKTVRNVGIERNLKARLEPIEAILTTEIVVVENVAKEDVENLSRCTPVARIPRQPRSKSLGLSVESPGKLLGLKLTEPTEIELTQHRSRRANYAGGALVSERR